MPYYEACEGEFVDFATLDDWETRDRAKDAEIARLTAALERAVSQVSDLSTKLGRAEGKLRASETHGVVEGWKRRAAKAEAERDAIAAAFAGITAPISFAETDDVMRIVKHKQVEQAGWLTDPLFLSDVLTEVLRKRVDRLTPADATAALAQKEAGE